MIRIAYEPDFLPLTCENDGAPEGLVIEILNLAFSRAGLEAAYVPLPLADHITALAADDVDAIAFKAITPGHDRGCDFSDPIIKTGAAWLAPTARPWTVADGVDRPRVATPATGPLVALIRDRFPELQIFETSSYDESLNAAATGEADVTALNYHIGVHLVRRGYKNALSIPGAPFDEMDAALAVAVDDPQNILPSFNRALAEFRSSGGIAKIEAAWL